MSYITRQMSVFMKKTTTKKTSLDKNELPTQLVNEPKAINRSVKIPTTLKLKDFTYAEFKKIADKVPFTKTEWSSILHISERTLQRYAKSNGVFASINAERAMQIDNVLKEAKKTFGGIDVFYHWLKRNPYMLEGNLSIESLTTNDGIQKVLTQLGRIQHGLFA